MADWDFEKKYINWLKEEYKKENDRLLKENAELKRLLKFAIEDMNILYEAGKDEGCLGIEFKWRYADEAMKLIKECILED